MTHSWTSCLFWEDNGFRGLPLGLTRADVKERERARWADVSEEDVPNYPCPALVCGAEDGGVRVKVAYYFDAYAESDTPGAEPLYYLTATAKGPKKELEPFLETLRGQLDATLSAQGDDQWIGHNSEVSLQRKRGSLEIKVELQADEDDD